MNKKSIFTVTAVALTLFASCSNGQKELPKNPKDKETYVDCNGNSWIWNAMLMRWAMSGSASSGNTYYYYPSTGNYTNTSGYKVDPPSNVKTGINEGIKARSASSYSSKSTSHHSGRSVFGSTGRGHSVSA